MKHKPQSWKEFADSKLLWWVNRSLHLFGWVIVLEECVDGSIKTAYPAKTKFRGFSEAVEEEGFETLTKHLAANMDKLLADSAVDEPEYDWRENVDESIDDGSGKTMPATSAVLSDIADVPIQAERNAARMAQLEAEADHAAGAAEMYEAHPEGDRNGDLIDPEAFRGAVNKYIGKPADARTREALQHELAGLLTGRYLEHDVAARINPPATSTLDVDGCCQHAVACAELRGQSLRVNITLSSKIHPTWVWAAMNELRLDGDRAPTKDTIMKKVNAMRDASDLDPMRPYSLAELRVTQQGWCQ